MMDFLSDIELFEWLLFISFMMLFDFRSRIKAQLSEINDTLEQSLSNQENDEERA